MTREELLKKMRKAEEAKRTMFRDRSEGEREFDVLIRQNPSDGMMYFKRGEAYEIIGDLELAEQDFHTALPLILPGKLDWKQRVQEALERVQKAQSNDKILGKIPPTLKDKVEAALNKTQESRANMLDCCTALEGIADHIASAGKLPFQLTCGLAEKTKTLREKGLIGDVTASHMHTIRVLRNGAAHGESVLADDANVSRAALRAVVTRVFSNSS
ncbi:MAG: hypothetical protein A3H27_00875 [Acidobacteria bacterium RIFCSPLOWO2_02_FULL_59_13]|nr:MAG: hypothetical protein A3H27_00875 [Acidobacteria bacterium RIFCSPLOWO2_02_FULL_59_13]